MTSTGINIGMEGTTRNSSKVLKPPGGGSSDIFGADSADEPRRQRTVSQLQSSNVFSNMMETVAMPKSKRNEDSHNRLFGDDPAPVAKPAPFATAAAVDHPNNHLGHSFFDDSSLETSMGAGEVPAKIEVKDVDTVGEVAGEALAPVEKLMSGFDSNKARDSRRNCINHEGMTAADCSQTYNNRGRTPRKTDGNPVTGEGYAIANGVKEMAAVASQVQAAPMTNGKVNGAPKVAAAPPAPAPASASRGRVPPGGYSSGLW